MFVHSVLLLFSGQVQANALDGTSVSVYQKCLDLHLSYLRKANYQRHTIYVRRADYLDIPDGLFQDYHVRFISDTDLFQLTAQGRQIDLIQFTPVKFGSGEYSFDVFYFTVSREEKHYEFRHGRGSTFRLSFNCQTNLFEINLIHQGAVVDA
jgi:hypothetical protein